MALRIKRGDVVVVRSGADKGKTGKVIRVEVATGRVVVEGVNLQYKHMKRTQQNPKGGRVRREGPIDGSKVMLWSEKLGKGQRFRVETREGKRVRVGAKDGVVFD
ncbi:MAG: 50S ribosomal protein L24 [Planctomycetes bacterium]|nr:50S ribosomal protein L24 [Planctomycetota bacterium]